MSDHIQKIKISCQSDWAVGQTQDGAPLRDWQISLVAVDNGKKVPGKLQAMLDHVEYILHPTFTNSRRQFKEEPYVLKEKGWGEFDLRIVLQFVDALFPPEVIIFDLNFKQPRYFEIHTISFTDVSVEAAMFLESLKAISKESQMANKKIPDAVTIAGRASLPDSQSSSPLSPPPSLPVLSPQSDRLTPHQPFDEISPLSDAPELDLNDNLADNDDVDGRCVEDDVANGTDLAKLNPIHYQSHDHDTCKAWDVPDDLIMGELAHRLTLLNLPQALQLEAIIRKHQTDEMTLEQREDELVMDLYSLGAPLLSMIWEFTEKLFGKNDTAS
ncbi:yeats family-domain-containing protein [Gongronella butleri]|nr:yeats family-domain-containing protein [Gongronella butleri]